MSEPTVAQKKPYVLKGEAGKKAWCSCGLSSNQPFCDGSHKTTEFKPKVVEVEEGKSIAWCGCKHTKNPPYCDGSHSKL